MYVFKILHLFLVTPNVVTTKLICFFNNKHNLKHHHVRTFQKIYSANEIHVIMKLLVPNFNNNNNVPFK